MKYLLLLAALLAAIIPALVLAQDDDDDDDDDGPALPRGIERDPVVEEVDREKAGELLDALEAAVKSREENLVVGALAPFITSSNEKFLKELEKLAKNRSIAIRVAAIKALGSQGPVKKVGSALMKILMSPQNKKEPIVLAMTVASLRRAKFDHQRVYDELESHFRKQLHTNIMKECARYFGDLKKVDAVKKLIGWVETPQPASVNSGSNPPASYWKRMWEIWEDIKPAVDYALTQITGREYDTEGQWLNWLDSQEARELGIR